MKMLLLAFKATWPLPKALHTFLDPTPFKLNKCLCWQGADHLLSCLTSAANLHTLSIGAHTHSSWASTLPHGKLPHIALKLFPTVDHSRLLSSCSASPPPETGTTGSSMTANPLSAGTQTPTSSSLHVTVEPLSGLHEGISVINLSRPDARNAIGRQLLKELSEALSNLRHERTTRCVVLRSTVKGVFCAGADLKERAAMTLSEASEFVRSLRGVFMDLQALPIPTIAAIDGFALGGGAELALACDLRVAGPEAVFAFPEAQLGIIPGAGGTQRLPRLIGTSRAKELIFTCRRVGVTEALEIGLVDHGMVGDRGGEGGAYEEALRLAQDVSRSAPLALRMAKEAVNQGMDVDLNSGMKFEEACCSQLLTTKDRLEGLNAFAAKRSPCYTGE